MASEADTSSAEIDPQMVGNSFVEQYYKALHQYPEHLHRFYQDSSVFSRPGTDGIVITVTTMKEINDQILSLEYQNYQTEIQTVDAQGSYYGGVMVLVTGLLTGKDFGKRKFSQSFFLAPQENGFYVLNDMFRFVDDDMTVGMPINIAYLQVDELQTAPIVPPPSVPDPEPVHAQSQSIPNHTTPATASTTTNPSSPEITTSINHKEESESLLPNQVAENHSDSNHATTTATSPEAITNNVKPEISSHEQLQNEKDLKILEKKTIIADHHHPVVSNQNGAHNVPETSTPRSPDSKKSFASIVHALKDNSAPFQIRVPAPTFRKPSSNGTKATDPGSNSALKRNNDDQAANTYTTFVANLPMDVTVDQIKQIFIKFGPIKPNSIRIRNNQLRPNCFCFIEYESASSMQNALEASPVPFGDRKVYVEEKKGGNDPVNERRNPACSQNDNSRSRVNSNGKINLQAAAATATTTTSSRYYHNDGRRVQKVSQNDGGRVGRQGQADKKNTSSVGSSRAAERTARK